MKFFGLLLIAQAFAHGEHLPGPNKGFIQMPAGFHVEVVPKKNSIEVFLLDIEFKNPVVDGSDVKASIDRDNKFISLSCAPAAKSFNCLLPKGESLKKGELKIRANRMGVVANEAVYSLPLKRPKAPKAENIAPDDHSGH